ncbi:MAG: histidine phosphatase family protein [Proteobacteria bacterium]|nr:histidine phosphatase family protein [Pseudomonadota bacterium]
MTLVALIRHGPTAWNEQRRTQGHRDIPLSEKGRAEVSRWRVPKMLEGVRVVASPLSRATETALLLFGRAPEIEPRLIEMNWSAWEGRTLAELRVEHGSAFTANEARGLDFRPAGGESPREVRHRIAPWLAEVARAGEPVAAVTHLGVIRALTSLALDWDMTGEPPCTFERSAAHLFTLDADGHPSVKELNLPLSAASP